MPTVPTLDALGFDPIGTLPGVQASPSAFGAGVGQATERAGAQLGQVVDQVDQRLTAISANNATNRLMDGLHTITSGDPKNPQDTGYFGLKGQAAIDGRAAAFQKLNDLQSSLSQNLDPEARLRFDADSRRIVNLTQGTLDQHFEQQTNVAALDSAKAKEQLAQQGLSIYANNEAGFQTHLATLDSAVHDQVAAIGGTNDQADAAIQAAHEKAYAGRVQILIGQGQPAAAKAVLDANQGVFQPATFEALQQHVQPILDRQNGEALAGKYLPGISGQSGTSDTIANAIHGQESGGSATSATSVDGARGGWQITPATFQQHANPGENINNPADNEAVGRRIIDGYSTAYGGDPSRVAVAYFSGPGNVAPPGSPTPYLQNKQDGNGTTTAAYVQGVLGRIGRSPAPTNAPSNFAPAVPDLDAAINKIEADPSATPEAKQIAITKATEYHSHMVAATAADRGALTDNLHDGLAALEAGKDYTPDEANIRRLLPDKADGILADLAQARTVGQATNSVQFAAPADINAKLAQLRTGLNTVDGFADHQQLFQSYSKAVDARNAALGADPATYVAQSPVVKAAAGAMNAGDPASVENYVRTSLGEQARLGVPPSQQHVLSNDQASSMVAKLTGADPSTTDIGAMLGKQAQTYGRYWPQVYGDLVAAKLPATYQVLGAMAPAAGQPDTQAAARTDLQTSIKQASALGGMQKYRDSLPPAEAKAVDVGVDSALADFQHTTRLNTDGQQLYANVVQAVKLQAYGYIARQGMDGTNAVEAAAKSVIGDKYDFDGSMRAPKGTMDTVQTATGNVLAGLKPGDLADIGGNPSLSPEQRQGIALDAAKRGQWVPNHDDTGLVLMGARKGGPGVVRLASGEPVQVMFSDAGRLAKPLLPMAQTDAAPVTVEPAGP